MGNDKKDAKEKMADKIKRLIEQHKKDEQAHIASEEQKLKRAIIGSLPPMLTNLVNEGAKISEYPTNFSFSVGSSKDADYITDLYDIHRELVKQYVTDLMEEEGFSCSVCKSDEVALFRFTIEF